MLKRAVVHAAAALVVLVAIAAFYALMIGGVTALMLVLPDCRACESTAAVDRLW